MPQAMPLNWLPLFFMFILIFIILTMKIYFSSNMMPMNMNMYNKKKINWKW
uniref:ATP synthase F0 subunit 8 n=1 Tax=Anisosticta novemdecimpunctata TaxID=185876 RepID=A0A191ZQT1_ANINO|nr:ATP synthase F0 subunit 8 [Anisosticta novemdecimpunctata]